jgi:signal peptidase I
MLILIAYAFVVGVGLAIIAWVGIDAARRKRNWLAWSAVTAFFGVFGLLAWLIRRRRAQVPPEPMEYRQALLIAMTAPILVGVSVAVTTSWTTFVFSVARVEGHAMAPTLLDQDRLIVNRMVFQRRDPQVGEMVMFYYPLNPEKSFVKRLIGEEGDQIQITDGRVFRNDVPLEEPFIPTEFRSHDDWGPQVIPQGYYFVLGDHRNNSSDSRHWSFVPKKYVVGRVQLRWWPISHARAF